MMGQHCRLWPNISPTSPTTRQGLFMYKYFSTAGFSMLIYPWFVCFVFQVGKCSIDHIELTSDVSYTLGQLSLLINLLVYPGCLNSLTLHCRPGGTSEPGANKQQINQLALTGCRLHMSDIIALSQHLDFKQLSLNEVTLDVDGQVGMGKMFLVCCRVKRKLFVCRKSHNLKKILTRC